MLEITLRSIQQYLYCKHRWGLIEINKSWSENYFVTKANIIHERVHNPKMNYNTNDKKRYTGVHVYNDTEPYNLYGVVLLNENGRKKVLTKWQEKKRSDIVHPYLKQKIQLGLLPYVQSNLLAKYVRGEINEYPVYIQK